MVHQVYGWMGDEKQAKCFNVVSLKANENILFTGKMCPNGFFTFKSFLRKR